MPSKNIPSLENLINQCCEHYYSKLNEHVEDELNLASVNSKDQDEQQQPNQYYSYGKFQDFINASHCQENLKFLIEIYHYEKIWNKTFKRQSSILKCKEEEPIFTNSRKQSVATIRTMNSKRSNRHPSIVEEGPGAISPPYQPPPPPQLQITADNDPTSQTIPSNPSNMLSNNDLDRLVQELSLPKILKNGDDFDCKSFVNQNMDMTTMTKTSNSNSNSHLNSRSHSPTPSPPNGVKPKRTSFNSHSSSKRNTEIWDTLFKPSYICEKNNECQCHPNNSSDPNLVDSNDDEVIDALEQQELLEQNKIELQEKFEYIIQDYVINNSPYQINLPDTVYSNLLKEYENNKILYHSPLTLLPAKNAVLQLLRENIYYNFLTDQENLINKHNSKKIITKMDELKLSNTNSNSTRSSSSSQPGGSTATNSHSNSTGGVKPEKVKTRESTKSIGSTKSNLSTRSVPEYSVPKKKKSKDKNLHAIEMSMRSNSSEESLKSKSNTPISTISNFLNKYNIKIHNNTTNQSYNSSSHSSLNSESSSLNSSSSPISPIQQSHSSTTSTTTSRELNTNFTPKPNSSSSSKSNSNSTSNSMTNSPLRKSFDKKRHSHTNNHGHGQGSSKYVKGPCGIEPEVNDFDPKPPKQGWSRIFNKKK